MPADPRHDAARRGSGAESSSGELNQKSAARPSDGGEQDGSGSAIAIVAACLVAGSLPMFLVAALGPRIDADLGIGTRGTGLVVAAFFLAAALGSVPGGRVADRLGSRRSLQVGLLLTMAGTAGAALAARGLVGLLIWSAIAGLAIALLDPGGSRTLARAVSVDRHGMAFGVKEASIPAASMLAGVSLPLVPAEFGWRPSFLGGALLGLVVALAIPRDLERPSAVAPAGDDRGQLQRVDQPAVWDAPRTDAEPLEIELAAAEAAAPSRSPIGDPARRRMVLVLLALVAGVGGGIAAGFNTYLVTAGMARGLAGAAGILMAVGSATAVVVRLVVGRLADRGVVGGELRLLRAALLIGGVGLALSALDSVAGLIVGGLIGLGAGWGWTGLVFLAAVRLEPLRPAAASGVVLAGLAFGGVVGPALFGLVAEAVGFGVVFGLAGALMLVVGVVVTIPLRATRQGR